MIPTLDPNITRPTRQQVFNAAVKHAARMTEHSVADGGSGVCRYRTDDGTNACFIGGMVTDDEARRMDVQDGIAGGTGFANLLDYGTDLVPERLRGHDLRHLLVSIQGVHDAQLGREFWPKLLRNVAQGYSLDASEVDREFASIPA